MPLARCLRCGAQGAAHIARQTLCGAHGAAHIVQRFGARFRAHNRSRGRHEVAADKGLRADTVARADKTLPELGGNCCASAHAWARVRCCECVGWCALNGVPCIWCGATGAVHTVRYPWRGVYGAVLMVPTVRCRVAVPMVRCVACGAYCAVFVARCTWCGADGAAHMVRRAWCGAHTASHMVGANALL